VARPLAAPFDEAHALAGLGRCALAAGQYADGVADLAHAREIFLRIGAHEAVDVAAVLDSLAGAGPTPN
jgi:hypothetical protein